jgi:hypothetical protein
MAGRWLGLEYDLGWVVCAAQWRTNNVVSIRGVAEAARKPILRGLWAAVASAAERDRSCACADDEPERIAAEAQPETPAFCRCDRGVALVRDRSNFRCVIGGIEFRSGELGLAGATVLNKIIERLQIGSGNSGGGRIRQITRRRRNCGAGFFRGAASLLSSVLSPSCGGRVAGAGGRKRNRLWE